MIRLWFSIIKVFRYNKNQTKYETTISNIQSKSCACIIVCAMTLMTSIGHCLNHFGPFARQNWLSSSWILLIVSSISIITSWNCDEFCSLLLIYLSAFSLCLSIMYYVYFLVLFALLFTITKFICFEKAVENFFNKLLLVVWNAALAMVVVVFNIRRKAEI